MNLTTILAIYEGNKREPPRMGWRPTLILAALMAAVTMLDFSPRPSVAGLGTEFSGVQQMVLQYGLNGFTGVEDATINSGAATTNFGGGALLKVSGPAWSGTNSGQNRYLIKFDVQAALPDSAVLVDATFQAYQANGGTAANIDTVECRRVMVPWDEGTGNDAGAVQSGKVCWTNRAAGPVAWTAAGCSSIGSVSLAAGQWGSYSLSLASGDSAVIGTAFCGTDSIYHGDVTRGSNFEQDLARDAISSTVTKGGVGEKNRQGWVTWDWTPTVRLWQIGAVENNGMLLSIHNPSGNRMTSFHSSQSTKVLNATSGYCYRPRLILRYIIVSGYSASGQAAASASRRGINQNKIGGR